MKLAVIILLVFTSIIVKANNPYRVYLLSKVSYQQHLHVEEAGKISSKTSCVIPHFERLKGAVFCRMEDYLTRKTNVWIKVGVQ